MFAIFRAEVRIIDTARRDALRRLLLDSVKATAPGEKLDEKLASMSLVNDSEDRKAPFPPPPFFCKIQDEDGANYIFIDLVPPPSSEEHSWWIDSGKRDGPLLFITCSHTK